MLKRWNVFLICFLFSCGCTSFKYNAKPQPISSLVTSQWSGTGSISIENKATPGLILLRSHDISYWGDLSQMTETAIVLLSGEFSKRGFAVTQNAPKVLKVKMLYAGLAFTLSFYKCVMQLQAETGNGYQKVYYGYNVGSSFSRACDGTLAITVAALLNDSKLIEYISFDE